MNIDEHNTAHVAPAPDGENPPELEVSMANFPVIIPPAAVRAHDIFSRRPTIECILDFTVKRHKIFYEDRCKAVYIYYDSNAEVRHAFVTALTFNATKFK